MIIRTLGLYQPFASLMRHGKLETRWVQAGRKPPFPIGRYLIYSTKQKATWIDLHEWCGNEIIELIRNKIDNDITSSYLGCAMCLADLNDVRLMRPEDEPRAFVKYKRKEIRGGKDYVQWILDFVNVQIIEKPFPFPHGKQGIGILSESETEDVLNKIRAARQSLN